MHKNNILRNFALQIFLEICFTSEDVIFLFISRELVGILSWSFFKIFKKICILNYNFINISKFLMFKSG